MTEKKYVFGYGSILNPASMAKDIDPKHFVGWTVLEGYERIFNVPVEGALALNLRECEGKSVEGVLIEATDEVMKALEKREKGYSAISVTSNSKNIDGEVVAFLAPQTDNPEMHILQSYVDECVVGVPISLRKQWIEDSIIENPIV
jgi:cation transport regulator ChaC